MSVHEHRQTAVNPERNHGVTSGPEDRCSAGVRIDSGEILRCERKGVCLGDRGILLEEDAIGVVEGPRRAARQEGAEFETAVHVREKRIEVTSGAAVFKIE